MAFFQILIPNYNSEQWIDSSLKKIFAQTFKDYKIHIADDQSTDRSPQIIKEWAEKYPDIITLDILPEKSGYPGGTRNYLVDRYFEGEYTLFTDSDDWFHDDICLQRIYETAIENNMPDLIRLSFVIFESELRQTYCGLKHEDNIEKVTVSPFIAPWTKAVKTKKLVRFPEHTLFEDIPQHLAQCDILETSVAIEEPTIVWNRQKSNTVSLTANLDKDINKKKLLISRFQMLADLYRLDLIHDYSKAMCESWINVGKGWLKSEKLV